MSYPTATPLKWHGGKDPLATRIAALLPPHRVYLEPFAGGASVLLRKVPAAVEILSDLNPRPVAVFKAIRDRCDELKARLYALNYDRQTFDMAKAADDAATFDPDDLDHIVNFFVRMRMSRGAMGEDFSFATRTRRGMNESVSAWLSAIDRMPAVSHRLSRVDIRCSDAREVIADFIDDPDALCYCDPPYPAGVRTSPDVYTCEMTDDDHLDLLHLLEHARCCIVLSGYDCLLYSDVLTPPAWCPRKLRWTVHQWTKKNNAGQGKKKQERTEYVWINPPSRS